ncbi:MAG: 50S ribosomal protein L1 [Candidatus Moranbacteria bacterium]|jgi:large subunit ribosomal protein L1|nr:50S ribosomal protein L1 [Candidatus Moranbacteria bacterium]MDD5652233.1 50S ribosomal protein L1 [Candidatus Moranbacteria bacterium]MDX9856021.1 50S ribosomal protein L1 [Candidatus Moranbacteria bacterium]
MKRGKKYKSVSEKIEKDKVYPIEDAIKIIKENKISKFDESVEVHLNTSIDPKKGDQQIRGSVVLPHGTGKAKKVAVITGTKEKEAKEAKADLVKGEDLIEDIKKGKINFDVLVATPEMMPKLAQVARILGPKGLMPNPKTDTVTEKVREAVEMIKKGKADFKNDNTGNVHQVIGKISFTEEQLKENFNSFIEAIESVKGEGVKGKFISKAVICSTMSPAVKVKI